MHRQTQTQHPFHSCCARLNKKQIKEREINILQSEHVSEGVFLPLLCPEIADHSML